MKKLMALCLAMIMALSMCAFTVMAEETEAPALAVTFEDIANGQPAKFVTSNLVLGENDEIMSSNEAIISNTGVVTRPIFDDATVTLTINGGEAVNVTVKAKTTNVLHANDFSKEATGWTIQVRGTNTPSSIVDGKFNVVIGATHVGETSQGRTNITYSMPSTIDYTKPVSIKFDVDNFTDLASYGADIRLNGGVYNADGTSYKAFSSSSFARVNSTSGFSSSYFTAGKDIDFKYDPQTGQIWTLATGALSAKTLVDFAGADGIPEGGYVKITSFYFTNATDNCTATFDVDDFVVYQEVSDEEALASATPAEKLASYSSLLDEAYVANGGSLSALTTNLKFTAENLPADVTLSWTSTNPAIAADGTVKRPVLDVATATITGTLQVGEESVSKSYNVTILPLAITGQSETVDFDKVGSVSDFTIESGGSGTVVTEAGNKVGSFTYSGSMKTYATYNFKTLPSLTNAEELIMEFKLRTENHSTAGTGNVTNYGFKVNGAEIAEFINYGGEIRRNNSYNGGSAGNGWHGVNNTDKIAYDTNSANYANFKIVIDVANKTAKHYLNGNQIGTSTVGIGLASLDSITSLSFYLADRSSGATIYVDDINVYTTQSLNSVISTLSGADKVAFYKELIEKSNIGEASAIGAVLDLDNGYADYDPATYGAAVNWASSNTAYISNDGTVAKLAPYGENVTVNMTATITAGSASDTVVFPVVISDVTSIATALHYAYDFTDYTLPEGAKYEIVADEDVAHGNVLKLDSAVGTKATIAHTEYGDGSRKERFVIETDFKYDSSSTGSPRFVVTTSAGARGIIINVNYNTGKVGLSTTNPVVNGYEYNVKGDVVVWYDMPESVKAKKGEWTHLLIDYNVLSETYQVSIDGIIINEIPVLNAAIVTKRTGGSVRHILYEHSGTGVLYADNLSVKDYDDDNVIEVNAALNAALVLYAAEHLHPVLSNGTLQSKTISLTWTDGTTIDKDESDLANNPAGYKVMEDSPALTYKVGDSTVTAINVTSPTEAEVTITAAKNGYSESKTFTRKLAPVAIRELSLGTENCLNGAAISGATGTEKLIVARYLDEKLVTAEVIDFAVTKDTGSRYDAAIGFVKDLSGYTHPNKTDAYDQIKLFVVAADGITPLALANTDLHD